MAAARRAVLVAFVGLGFTGEILGYQPTGRTVVVSGIAVHRVANGQLVEHWANLDMAGFIHQLELGDEVATAP